MRTNIAAVQTTKYSKKPAARGSHQYFALRPPFDSLEALQSSHDHWRIWQLVCLSPSPRCPRLVDLPSVSMRNSLGWKHSAHSRVSNSKNSAALQFIADPANFHEPLCLDLRYDAALLVCSRTLERVIARGGFEPANKKAGKKENRLTWL